MLIYGPFLKLLGYWLSQLYAKTKKEFEFLFLFFQKMEKKKLVNAAN
jgi:hypothetical protein